MNKTAHTKRNLLAGLLISAILFGLAACRSSVKPRTYSTNYFSLAVPKNYVMYEKAKKNGADECSMYFADSTTYGQRSSNLFFIISVKKEPASAYRKRMNWDVELIDSKSPYRPTRVVNGLLFTEYSPSELSGIELYYRHEKGRMSVKISYSKDAIFIDEILESITFNLPDLGLSDPPLPWEREIKKVDDSTLNIGPFGVEAKQIAFDQREFANAGAAYNAAFHGVATEDYYYTLDLTDNTLKIYTINGDRLDFMRSQEVFRHGYYIERTSKVAVTIEADSAGNDGMLLVEKSVGGENVKLRPLYGDVAVSPDQSLCLFHEDGQLYKRTIKKTGDEVSFADEPFELKSPEGASFTSEILFVTDHYIVTQTIGNQGVVYTSHVFDHDGNYLMNLPGEIGYADNFYDIDGCLLGVFNYPLRIVMWDTNGHLIGLLTQDELLGLPMLDNVTQPASLAYVKSTTAIDGSTSSTEFILLLSYAEDGIGEAFPFRITITS